MSDTPKLPEDVSLVPDGYRDAYSQQVNLYRRFPVLAPREPNMVDRYGDSYGKPPPSE